MRSYEKKGPFNKICETCGRPFAAQQPNAKYCGEDCRPQYKKPFPGLNTGQVGAIGELRVCTDLLARGFEVFRSVSPACSCDLIALKNGAMLRIEVRTACKTRDNKVQFPGDINDKGKQDHFAAVLPDQIIYLPNLEEKA